MHLTLRILPDGVIVGKWEWDGSADSIVATDSDPILSPGRFYVAASLYGGTGRTGPGFVDDVCYTPLSVPLPLNIACPAGFAIECPADVPVCDPSQVTVSGGCSPVVVTCADGPLVGGPCGGTITRTFTATDGCGNMASCDQVITVKDDVPPVIGYPGSVTFAFISPTDAMVTWPPPSATDNCNLSPAVSCDPPSGSMYLIGSQNVTCTANDGCGNTARCSSRFVLVPFDIKPGSCPNPLNISALRGAGSASAASAGPGGPSHPVFPVAILGTASLDVTTIDPSTLRLAGVRPLRWDLEDVATPVTRDPLQDCKCTTAGADGYRDLTVKFDEMAIIAAIGSVNNGDRVMLMITGKLRDGTPLAGADCVLIRAAKGASAASAPSAMPPFTLADNYPNPFNAGTTIRYSLTDPGRVNVTVFNILGQRVATLADDEQAPGEYSVTWDGRDEQGTPVPSGMYFYRLTAGDQVQSKKMVLLK
ncbi:MAG: T9SS type A sorting domain-containing protein [candidate division Zixibacteria bacterium]|nr:T9SS type A sorting domain-containing protein [candidate division Zixibacteria bacterium]